MVKELWARLVRFRERVGEPSRAKSDREVADTADRGHDDRPAADAAADAGFRVGGSPPGTPGSASPPRRRLTSSG
jgi:hypothetical protein